jgi:hypothetical protein
MNTENSTNDNSLFRSAVYRDSRCLEFVPIATYIIDKYVQEFWKNDKESYWYNYMVHSVCLKFVYSYDRDSTIYLIANAINVNPILLHNDETITAHQFFIKI